jgi:hypothetical protein
MTDSKVRQANALKIKRTGRTPSFVSRLQSAVRVWNAFTENPRKLSQKMLLQYQNGYYSGKTGEFQPMNLIDRGVSIIAPYLISKNPRILVDAKQGVPASRSFARTLELALEHLFREIRLSQQTLRPAVFNSLFDMGVVKTGIMTAYQVEVFGYLHDVGQPYADCIPFEDYVGDPRARNREEMLLEGNHYWLPEEFLKTSGLFKHTDSVRSREVVHSETHPDEVSKKSEFTLDGCEDLRPMVRVTDLWIPDERIVVTIPIEGQGDKIMRTVDYDGPEEGCYDVLRFKTFPGTLIPIPPVFNMLGLNSIINRLVRKMSEQAQREKKVLLYDLASADDAELTNKTDDGGLAGVRNTEGMKEIEFGGVSETNFVFMNFLEQQYSIQGGNLYTIGGRETQADTLGQEQMLQANASKQLQDMVGQVHEFTKNIVHKLAWYLWSDPFIQIPVIKEIGEFKLNVSFTPDKREGDFLDYTFDIEPYSMASMSPEMRYQRLLQLVGQVILPTVQIAASQGSMLNVDELVKEAARFLDIKNIDKWWTSAMPQQAAPNPYQPLEGTGAKTQGSQGDGRYPTGQDQGSNESNSRQHMARTAGEGESRNAVSGRTKSA